MNELKNMNAENINNTSYSSSENEMQFVVVKPSFNLLFCVTLEKEKENLLIWRQIFQTLKINNNISNNGNLLRLLNIEKFRQTITAD